MIDHRLVADDQLHKCICGDWHPGSFYEAERATPAVDVELLEALNILERTASKFIFRYVFAPPKERVDRLLELEIATHHARMIRARLSGESE